MEEEPLEPDPLLDPVEGLAVGVLDAAGVLPDEPDDDDPDDEDPDDDEPEPDDEPDSDDLVVPRESVR